MQASCREEVFSTLRSRGIRAIKVVAQDGSRANGEIRGVKKRAVTVIALLAALFTGATMYLILGRHGDDGAVSLTEAKPLIRQAIRGDRKKLEINRSELFPLRAEAFLSAFAEPGVNVALDNLNRPSEADFKEALSHRILTSDSELTEYVDLKRMVAWIKQEMMVYLNGGGSVSEYVNALEERQKSEIEHYESAERGLQALLSQGESHDKDAYEFWLKSNAYLQSMGIRALPFPNKLRSYQFRTMTEE